MVESYAAYWDLDHVISHLSEVFDHTHYINHTFCSELLQTSIQSYDGPSTPNTSTVTMTTKHSVQ